MRKFLRILIKSVVAVLMLAVAAAAGFIGLLVWHFQYGIGLPTRQELAALMPGSKICSSDRERVFVPLAEIPPVVRSAILAAEEPHFYERPAINDPVRQLLHPEPWRSPISFAMTRCLMHVKKPRWQMRDWHIGSIIVMGRLERTLTRDFIFELYLNEMWFGRGAYGVNAAANAWFGKPLSSLTVDEAAYLAALLRSPSSLSHNLARGTERRNFVIDRMQQAGAISAAEAEAAKQRPLNLQDAPAP
jgi:penicillin-binding protein 1A